MSGLESLGDVRGKRVLVRSDLNVPLAGTTITDRPGPEMMAELRLDEQMSSWKEFILECHARAKRSRT